MSQEEEFLKAEQLLQKIKETRSDNDGENINAQTPDALHLEAPTGGA